MSLSPANSAQTASVAAVTWIPLTQNLGASGILEGTFTITDSAIAATSNVVIVPTSLGGSRADEATMDPLFCVAVAGDGEATVYWTTMGQGRVSGQKAFLYTVA